MSEQSYSFWDIGNSIVPRSGNYGGPVWTAGTNDATMFDVQSLYGADEYYKNHDFNYYRAEYEPNPSEFIREADKLLVAQLTGYTRTEEFSNLTIKDKAYVIGAIMAFSAKIDVLGIRNFRLDIPLAMKVALQFSLKQAQATYSSEKQGHCFPAGTKISLPHGKYQSIEGLRAGDCVLSFDKTISNSVNLSLGRVSRLFFGVTSEWLILSCGLMVTRGHRFFNEDREFERIDQLIARGGKIVLEDGSLNRDGRARCLFRCHAPPLRGGGGSHFSICWRHCFAAGNPAGVADLQLRGRRRCSRLYRRWRARPSRLTPRLSQPLRHDEERRLHGRRHRRHG